MWQWSTIDPVVVGMVLVEVHLHLSYDVKLQTFEASELGKWEPRGRKTEAHGSDTVDVEFRWVQFCLFPIRYKQQLGVDFCSWIEEVPRSRRRCLIH